MQAPSHTPFVRFCLCVVALLCGLRSVVLGSPFSTTVKGDASLRASDGATAVSVIELGLPGSASAPAAAKVSVAEAIVGQPGVQVRHSGGLGQWSGASLRGSAPGQVAVFLDGVPLSRGSQAAVDLSQLPLDGLERVEIYRGVAPLELGSETLGGAINLVTRRGQGPATTWLSLGSGSFGLRRVSVGYKAPSPRLMLSAAYQRADGDFPYYFNEGLRYGREQLDELRRKNDDFSQLSVDARVEAEGSSTAVFVHGSGVLRRQGVAGIGQPSSQAGHPELQMGRVLLDGGVRWNSPSQRVRLVLDTHGLLDRTQSKNLEALPPILTEQLSQQIGSKAILRIATGPAEDLRKSQLLTVAEVRYEKMLQRDLCPSPRLDCDRATEASSDRLRGVLSLGGELSLADRRLLFEPGLHLLLVRSSYHSLGDRETESQPTDFAVLPSPRAAARVLLRPWLLLRMSCGRFVRLPTFLELFGDGAFFRKSLGLRPESAWTGELGIEAHGQPTAFLSGIFSVHAFGRNIDDLIDVVRDGPTLRARNVGQATAGGVEMSAAGNLRDLLRVELTYTFLDTRDQTDQPGRSGNLLPGRPRHAVFLRGEAAYRPIRLFYELDFVSALFLDPANLVERPARTLHALGILLGPVTRFRATLRVEIRNLLDTRTVDMALPLQMQARPVPLTDFFDYPLPGRALFATLAGRL